MAASAAGRNRKALDSADIHYSIRRAAPQGGKYGKQRLSRPFPGKKTERGGVGLSMMCYTSGKECVGCIEFLIVFPVAALNFSVVSGRIGLNQFMLDPKFSKSSLKESLFWVARAEPICKL